MADKCERVARVAIGQTRRMWTLHTNNSRKLNKQRIEGKLTYKQFDDKLKLSYGKYLKALKNEIEAIEKCVKD